MTSPTACARCGGPLDESGICLVCAERERVVWGEIERASEAFCERMDGHVRTGRLTRADVTSALVGYPDYADAWDTWNDQDDETETEDEEQPT